MIFGLRQILSMFYQWIQLHCIPLNVPAERQAETITLESSHPTQLQEAFNTAPILKHPDPSRPFVMEVDALETGVGHILWQRFGDEPRLHPVAFFSKKLSWAEWNYEVGNWELFAVKLALEEWRHWLEGATHSIICTDHKNLEYLHTAMHLTPRQACWSLFFSCFQFTLSYDLISLPCLDWTVHQ